VAQVQRSIALLRAINVGGHTVKMDQLRALFAALGYANVATYIASGNVIFETPPTSTQVLEEQIERHLRDALGYEVLTFIRTADQLAAIAGYAPFPPSDEAVHGLYVSFLKAPLSQQAQQNLLALNSATDEFHAHGCEFYWLCRTRLSESPLFSGTLLNKMVGMPTTMRNVTTVRKLAAKYAMPQ
jgi:uncharacterized protein (DUF1697 family)